MRFDSLIGQETAKEILITTIDRDQLPNSFLFSGPEGVGKWAAALALTAYLNCRRPSDHDSCGTCPPCRQIAALQYPNLYIAIPTPPSKSEKEELDNYRDIIESKISEPYRLIGGRRQMSIPVATVREIKRNLGQKPAASGRRVVIIEQMDRMLVGSADALLKLIEEPPRKTLIIVTSSRPDKIQTTIVSRCRQIKFSHLNDQEIAGYLVQHSDVPDKKAKLIARLSTGSLGRALYLVDEENLQDRELAKMIFRGTFREEIAEVIAEAVDLLPLSDRFRLNRIISYWQSLFRDLILLQTGAERNQIINFDFMAELERLAAREIDSASLLKIPARLGSIREDIDLNVEPRSALGAALVWLHDAVRIK